MRMTVSGAPWALSLAGALVLSAFSSAHAAPAAPAVATPEVSIVTVLGRMAPRISPTVRRLSSSMASSCAYDFAANDQDYIDAYLDSFHGRGRHHGGNELDGPDAENPSNGSFREGSPYGDAGSAGPATTAVLDAGRRSSCTQASYSAQAGRNRIARTDKSLDQAYAAYDKRDYNAALAAFEASYNKTGWDEAALMAGAMYEAGQGTAPDRERAIVWYEKLALARLVKAHYSRFDPRSPQSSTPRIEAQLRLAQMHLTSDPVKARKWYGQAAQLDYAPAQLTLGRMLHGGFGGDKDVAGARKLYLQAAEVGYVPAQMTLAQLYQQDGTGAADQQAALGWLQKVAFSTKSSSDKTNAQYALAQAYDEGIGVAANPSRALSFYKLAAVAGHPAAQNALATYFHQGQQVGKDLPLARKLFLAAASQKHDGAMVNAAAMLYRGEGGVVDPVQALGWLRLAAKMGNEQAVKGVPGMEQAMAPVDLARANKL